MIVNILRWIAVLALAFAAGKLMTKIIMPSIFGWLIVGMLFGPMPPDYCHGSFSMPDGIERLSCGCSVLLG